MSGLGPERAAAGTEPELGDQVRSGLRWSLLDNTAGRLISLGTGIVVARILVPSEFGVFAIALVALNLLNSINDVGMSASIVRWPGKLDDVAPTALTLIFVFSLVGYAIFFAAAPWYCTALHAPQAAGVLRLLSLAVVIDGATAVPTAVLTRSFRQDRRAIADLSGIALQTVLTIVLAAAGFGAWSLAWGWLAGNAVTALLTVVFSPARYRPGFSRDAMRRLLVQGAPLSGSTLLTVAILNVDYMAVGRILGPIALGFYVLAFNMSSWPVNLLSVPIQRISIPGFARLQEDRRGFAAGFHRSVTLLVAVTIPVCVVMAVLSHQIITFVYGNKWAAAASVLRFLALFAVVRIVQNLSWDALVAIGRAHITLWLQWVWLIVLVPALIIACHLGGIAGVGLGQLIVGMAVVVPLYLFALSRAGVKVTDLGPALLGPALGGAVAALGTAFVSHQVTHALPQLLAGGSTGVVLYLVVLLPLRWWRPADVVAPESVSR